MAELTTGTLLLPKKFVMPESSVFDLELGLVGDVGLVGDIHRNGQDVADLVRTLIFEKRARTVSP